MRKKAISILLILSCTFFVICSANQDEYIALEKLLRSISKVVVEYKSEFDTRVKFAELQKAIDLIDKSMLGYQGIAKKKLDKLRTLNSDARNAYRNCVGPVFQWCISINSTLDIFIPYVSKNLKNEERDIIWNMTVEALIEGQQKTSSSLELLKHVQTLTSDLKNLLGSILHDMHDDFGPSGYYGKRKQELEAAIEESKKSRQAMIIAGAITFIFGAIASIVVGPIGVALALLPTFIDLGLGAVVQGHKKATYEEELQAIQAFFNILDKRINEASSIASQVNKDLEEDKKNLNALSGFISAADRNKRILLADNPDLRALLVPSLRNLGKMCYEYTMWHGYGSSGYAHNQKRPKRHATETCRAQRMKAWEIIIDSMPLNTTMDTLVCKAHSLYKQIDCEYLALPLQMPYTQTEMSFSNAKPNSFYKITEKPLPSSKCSMPKRSPQRFSILLPKNMITTRDGSKTST